MFKSLTNQDGEYPRMVSVETTSRCNASCPFCPYSVRSRGKTHMTDELFDKIITECGEFPLQAIEPFLNGEPFVDPKIMPRLEAINSRLPDTKLRVYSNGYALKPKRIDELCDLNIDHLYISLNTLDPIRYKEIMGFELARTLENVKYMCDPIRRHKVAGKITLRMTRLADTSIEEQAKFRAFCKEQGVRCFIVGLFNYKGDINSEYPIPNYACEHITRLDILSSGKVALCCMDQEGEHSLGDVNTHSVLEVHRGVVAKKYRDMHRSGRRAEIEPCGTCNLFWPSTDNMPLHQSVSTTLQLWWYFMRYRPTGIRPPAPPELVCEDHAAQLPDVPLIALKRDPRKGSDSESKSAD